MSDKHRERTGSDLVLNRVQPARPQHVLSRQYLRPTTPPPIPAPSGRQRITKAIPAFFLLSMVSVVLFGRGFWSESTPLLSESAPMETINLPPDGQSSANESPISVPVAQGTTPAPLIAGSSSANYRARPAMPITNSPQRIDTVRARRDETLNVIAARSGVSVNALLWANDLTDPDMPLPVGLVIKVPPPGTMLHRIRVSDTLDSIAKAYRVTVDAITRYPGNVVQQSGDLVAGDFLIIPTLNLPMRDHVIFYKTRAGDTLSKITGNYGLRDPQTLQWANSITDANLVQPGQVLAIPPTDGVIFVVKDDDAQRDTTEAVTGIAKSFACAAVPCRDTPTEARIGELRDAVFNFGPNHLARTGRLIPGQEIVIPGGIPYIAPPPVIIPPDPIIDNPGTTVLAPAPSVTTPKPVPVPARRPAPAPAPVSAFPGAFPSIYYPPQGAGSGRNPGFIWPETGVITSTYNPAHNGIDVATPANTPLHAAAAGYVVFAGWTESGLGNAVYIDHGNGFVTVYGHMNGLAVKVGQYIQQGEYIGPEGSTGNSTGPHIHFMIIENNRSVNPFNYLP